jgi:thiamine-phosphate pyrophosphorylase
MQTGARLIINDHVELARAVDAHGVHVGAEDAGLQEARAALGPEKIVGVSCYNRLELARDAQAAGADYVAFGSFFPSSVKPHAVRAPVELLLQARRELHVPIVAIGGITLEGAPRLISAGADALAVISALFDAPDISKAALDFSALFHAANEA